MVKNNLGFDIHLFGYKPGFLQKEDERTFVFDKRCSFSIQSSNFLKLVELLS